MKSSVDRMVDRIESEKQRLDRIPWPPTLSGQVQLFLAYRKSCFPNRLLPGFVALKRDLLRVIRTHASSPMERSFAMIEVGIKGIQDMESFERSIASNKKNGKENQAE